MVDWLLHRVFGADDPNKTNSSRQTKNTPVFFLSVSSLAFDYSTAVLHPANILFLQCECDHVLVCVHPCRGSREGSLAGAKINVSSVFFLDGEKYEKSPPPMKVKVKVYIVPQVVMFVST